MGQSHKNSLVFYSTIQIRNHRLIVHQKIELLPLVFPLMGKSLQNLVEKKGEREGLAWLLWSSNPGHNPSYAGRVPWNKNPRLGLHIHSALKNLYENNRLTVYTRLAISFPVRFLSLTLPPELLGAGFERRGCFFSTEIKDCFGLSVPTL